MACRPRSCQQTSPDKRLYRRAVVGQPGQRAAPLARGIPLRGRGPRRRRHRARLGASPVSSRWSCFAAPDTHPTASRPFRTTARVRPDPHARAVGAVKAKPWRADRSNRLSTALDSSTPCRIQRQRHGSLPPETCRNGYRAESQYLCGVHGILGEPMGTSSGAQGGSRTLTPLRTLEPKSSPSTSSGTWAMAAKHRLPVRSRQERMHAKGALSYPHRPGGEIGRHKGLKIPRRNPCRFDSGPGHQAPYANHQPR